MQRNCDLCGRSYDAKRSTSKFCGVNCRNRNVRRAKPAHSEPAVQASAPEIDAVQVDDLVAVTKAELEAAGKLNTSLGQQAVRLAERMRSFDTGGGLAALSREFRAVMAEATRGVKVSVDVVDELRARRDAKRAG